MNCRNVRLFGFGLCALLNCAIVRPAAAADHNDAPDIKGAEGSFVDITDVYAFRSPTDANNFVLYLGMFTPEVAGETRLFATNARYEIYVDTDLDFRADDTIRTTFRDNDDGTQSFRMTGVPGASTIEGAVSLGTDAVVATDGPAKAFAGLRGDNFFFDLVGFQNFVAAPCVPSAGLRCPGTGAPADFFLGRSTATIAVKIPVTELSNIGSTTSGRFHVWAKTFTED